MLRSLVSCQCHDATQSAPLYSESPKGAGAPSSLHRAIACATNLRHSFLLRQRRAHSPEQMCPHGQGELLQQRVCSRLDRREMSFPPPAAIALPAEAMLMFVFTKWQGQ